MIAGNDYHQTDKLRRMTNKNLAEYYAKRALEYDKIYNKPERQNDIKFLPVPA